MNTVVISQYSGRIHGIPRYATELARNLERTRLLQYNVPADATDPPTNSTIRWPRPDTPASVAVGKFVTHPLRLRSLDADVYHAADPREVVPLWLARRKPLVTTLHDLIVYKFARAFKRRWTYLSRAYLQFLDRSDRVIAVSESTKQDAVDVLGIDPEKIDVVYHGVGDQFRPLDERNIDIDIHRPAILMVGRPQPRKNHVGVARALARLHDRGIEAHLYVVGADDSEIAELEQPGTADYIHATGYVDDGSLVEYYNAADVVAVPSYYEGFGFPVLEAMACGTPVVTSDRSSLSEIAGDVAPTVDPDDVEELAEALGRILSDERMAAELTEMGIERATEFTWDRTADETESIYRDVL